MYIMIVYPPPDQIPGYASDKKSDIYQFLLPSLTFLPSFRWFCHFDDDQYVNVAGLVWKLREFAAEEDWYLGKPSLEKPLEIIDRDGDVFKQVRHLFIKPCLFWSTELAKYSPCLNSL